MTSKNLILILIILLILSLFGCVDGDKLKDIKKIAIVGISFDTTNSKRGVSFTKLFAKPGSLDEIEKISKNEARFYEQFSKDLEQNIYLKFDHKNIEDFESSLIYKKYAEKKVDPTNLYVPSPYLAYLEDSLAGGESKELCKALKVDGIVVFEFKYESEQASSDTKEFITLRTKIRLYDKFGEKIVHLDNNYGPHPIFDPEITGLKTLARQVVQGIKSDYKFDSSREQAFIYAKRQFFDDLMTRVLFVEP